MADRNHKRDSRANPLYPGPVDSRSKTSFGSARPRFAGQGTPARGKRERVKQNPAFFDAKGLEVTQHFVTSKDGTRVPYFEVAAKGRSAPGPALLYA